MYLIMKKPEFPKPRLIREDFLPESVSSWWDYWWFWQSINENADVF